MTKQINGKWYYQTETWEPLEEPDSLTKQRCALFREGQADRKAGKGMLRNFGSYLDGYHSPDEKVPPIVNRHQAEAFNL